MLADKGYDDTKIRVFLKSIDISSDIPQREVPVTWREKVMLAAKGELRQRKEKKRKEKRREE